jgi:hypothetical protein
VIAGTRCCTSIVKQPGPAVSCGCGWSMPVRSYKQGVRLHQQHVRLVRGSR